MTEKKGKGLLDVLRDLVTEEEAPVVAADAKSAPATTLIASDGTIDEALVQKLRDEIMSANPLISSFLSKVNEIGAMVPDEAARFKVVTTSRDDMNPASLRTALDALLRALDQEVVQFASLTDDRERDAQRLEEEAKALGEKIAALVAKQADLNKQVADERHAIDAGRRTFAASEAVVRVELTTLGKKLSAYFTETGKETK